jgi:hypothetical protein
VSAKRSDAMTVQRLADELASKALLEALQAEARTRHWFDPCKLLEPDPRSEYGEQFRERQPGGGWKLRTPNNT